MFRRTPDFLGLAFFVVVMAGCGGGITTTGGPTMNQSPPVITAQPGNVTVMPGATATFSVTASGTQPITFQWQRNGAAISGATSSSYTTPATTTSDNGATFQVVAMNAVGSETSNPATLTVSSTAPPPPPVSNGTNVTTYKNDLARTGQNLTETTLTLANVNSTMFGLLRNLSVTGKVDAQPLYLSQFSIGGTAHNVVYVATEHDMVYAFDSDTGATLWSKSVLGANETTSDNRGCGQVSPEIGITSTPVIDLTSGPHGAIYVVGMSKNGGTYHQRLHALDLTTGAELFGGPTEVTGSLPMNSGTNIFDPAAYKERPGLLLLNGIVYTVWSSHCDDQPYSSWIMGYSESTLQQTVVFNVAANSNGRGPSIWMSGGAPAVDAAGNIFVLEGNGTFETTLTAGGFPNEGDYGNAFVRLTPGTGTLAVTDYFEEFNEITENNQDTDLGSGSAMVLPDMMDSGGNVHHLAVGAGKDSNIYVVNRDNMGKFNSSSNNIYQQVSGVLSGGIWSTPAYFQNTVYYGDVGGTLKAFKITNAKLSTSPTAQTNTTFGFPGTAPAISANGSSNGIVWAAENSSPAVLHAYNATTLVELYNSAQSGSRDRCGSGNKFVTPTIADGKVFLGTQNSVCVFGVLP